MSAGAKDEALPFSVVLKSNERPTYAVVITKRVKVDYRLSLVSHEHYLTHITLNIVLCPDQAQTSLAAQGAAHFLQYCASHSSQTQLCSTLRGSSSFRSAEHLSMTAGLQTSDMHKIHQRRDASQS